jgi:CelD/BcsL family acetyltransferase involved in cellulose biosynthesis
MFGYIDSNIEHTHKYLSVKSQIISNELFFVRDYLERYFLTIPDALDDLRKQHSKKSLYNIKRAERKLYEDFDGVAFKVLKSRSEIEEFLPRVQNNFKLKWRGRYTSLKWKNDKVFAKFSQRYLEKADQGKARLFVLIRNNDLLAFHYCIIHDHIVSVFQHNVVELECFRAYALGRTLTYRMIGYLIDHEKEIHTLDFMYGYNEYKRFWATGQELTYMCYRRSILGRLSFLLDITKSKVKLLLKTSRL